MGCGPVVLLHSSSLFLNVEWVSFGCGGAEVLRWRGPTPVDVVSGNLASALVVSRVGERRAGVEVAARQGSRRARGAFSWSR